MAPTAPNHNWVDLTFLGGVGEIGLNMMTLETADHLVVVDAGLMFPEDPMLGIDIVIPDFTYLRERRDKLMALVLTHGHEDHIGAVPFFLKEFAAPIYGTPLTLALLREKLKEHGLLNDADLREIRPSEPLSLGPFEFEFVRVCHSIVDGVGSRFAHDRCQLRGPDLSAQSGLQDRKKLLAGRAGQSAFGPRLCQLRRDLHEPG